MQRDLGRDLVGLDPASTDHHGHPGLVARRLDRQDPRPAHRSSRARSRANELAHLRLGEVGRGHDEGVLAVVAVVARPATGHREAEGPIQRLRRLVRDADLERHAARADRHGQLGQVEEELAADALASPVRMDAEGRDMGVVDHQPHAREADDGIAGSRHQVPRQPVPAQLLLEGIRRPGRREAEPLDLVDGRDIIQAHAVDHDACGQSHAIRPSCSTVTPRGARR